jgi:NAD-dependent SIR2 family protein deacetylase
MLDAYAKAARLIEQSDALVIAGGAGMGVDSGLPDFRGNDGFWKAYPALGKARMDFTDVASPRTFRRDPALAWGFYGHRLALYRDTVPHPGFGILRRWSQRMPHGAFVFTSNVDGQFQKAGFADDRIHECHGSIHFTQCLKPCTLDIRSASGVQTQVDHGTCRWIGALPSCPVCRKLARPNILMFGDDGWLSARSDQQGALLGDWLKRVQRPVIVELGAGVDVPSVRRFSSVVAREFGGALVRINPRDAEVPGDAHVGIRAGALVGLQAIDLQLAT